MNLLLPESSVFQPQLHLPMVSKKMILIKIGVQNVLFFSDTVNKLQKIMILLSRVSFIVTLRLSATEVVIFQVLVIQED